jgi:hypothetical protein
VLGGLRDNVCMVETSSVPEPAQTHSRFSGVTGGAIVLHARAITSTNHRQPAGQPAACNLNLRSHDSAAEFSRSVLLFISYCAPAYAGIAQQRSHRVRGRGRFSAAWASHAVSLRLARLRGWRAGGGGGSQARPPSWLLLGLGQP